MEAADVAVIIPTYNRLSVLPDALDSVLAQTCPPREVLVVNDGSTDGTVDWLRERYGSVRVLQQSRQGPGPARNLGVRHSSSRWIAFLDSDDRWQPRKLEAQLAFLSDNPEYRVCQTEEIWIRNGRRVNPMRKHGKPSGEIFIPCLSLCLISPSAVLLERGLWEELGGFDPAFPVCEDYELWLRLTLRHKVATLPEALTVKYGGHPDQLSRQYWGMDRFRVLALKKILRGFDLSPEQRTATLEVLREKLRILSQGFAKRHPDEGNPYLKDLEDLGLEA